MRLVAILLVALAVTLYFLGLGPLGGAETAGVAPDGQRADRAQEQVVDPGAANARSGAEPAADEREQLRGQAWAVGLRGRLRQGEAALPGVRVRLRKVPVRDEEPPLAQTVTAADGGFALPCPQGERMRLDLHGPGIPPGTFNPLVRHRGSGIHDLGDLQVPAGVALTGQVELEGGAGPVAEARVYWVCRTGGSYEFRLDEEASEPFVLTDHSGRYELPPVAPQQLHLWVEKPGLGSASWSGAVVEQRRGVPLITLKPGRQVIGVVRGGGRPLAGARVAAVEGRYSGARINLRKAVRAGPDGSFVLEGVGYDKIHVSHPGYLPQTLRWARLKPPRVITLLAEARLHGQVTGAGGRPVRLILETDPRGKDVADAEVGESFQLGGLAAGRVRARAWVEGVGMSALQRLELRHGETSEHNFRIEPHPVLQVRVRSPRGLLPGAKVSLSLYRSEPRLLCTSHPSPEASTDAQGLVGFAVPGSLHGQVRVSHPDFQDHRQTLPPWQPGQTVEVVLPPAGKIRGRVLGRESIPEVWLRVGIRKQGSTSLREIYVDAENRFCSKPLAPGRYEVGLTLQAQGSNRRRQMDPRSVQEVELGATRDPEELVLQVQPLGTLSGRVFAGPEPVAAAELRLSSKVGEDRFEGRFGRTRKIRTNDQGAYRIPLATTGRFFVEVRAPGAIAFSPAQELWVERLGEDLQHDIQISRAQIAGQLRLDSLSAGQRETWRRDPRDGLKLQLYPQEQAGESPFAAPHHGAAPCWFRASARPDERGRFRIPNVPAGSWELRLIFADHRLLGRWSIDIEGHEQIDLGEIRAPQQEFVDLDFEGVKLASPAFRLRACDPQGQPGAFVQWGDRRRGKLRFSCLPPGRYLVELCEVPARRGRAPTGYVPPRISTGRFVQMTLHADGRVEPRVLVFADKK